MLMVNTLRSSAGELTWHPIVYWAAQSCEKSVGQEKQDFTDRNTILAHSHER